MTNLETAKKYEEYIIAMRRHFHENPELSGKEFETLKRIDAELTAMGIEHVEVENGGILGFVKGKEDNGKAVLIRGDMDALPVLEKQNLNGTRTCISKNEGVMHACGHDAHTAMLLGTAKVLLDKKDEIKGTVILCFERSEETSSNANAKFLWKYLWDNEIKVDACYGTHVWSMLPSGTIGLNDTDCMAGAMAWDITIEGRGGHGSRPDQSNSPIDCFCAIYQRLEALRLTKVDPFKTCAYSIGKLNAGIQGNVIPQTVNFSGTMRTFDCDGAGMQFHDAFKKAVDGICAAYDCTPTYNFFTKPASATVNDPECAQFARKVINADFGYEAAKQVEPWMGSESFGSYMKMWPGCMAHLGIANPEKGCGAAHHNEAFDVDEAVLANGAAAAATYAIEFLKTPEVVANCAPKMNLEQLLASMPKW